MACSGTEIEGRSWLKKKRRARKGGGDAQPFPIRRTKKTLHFVEQEERTKKGEERRKREVSSRNGGNMLSTCGLLIRAKIWKKGQRRPEAL